MAQFQARAEAAKDIELEPLKVHIFKGRDMRCRRDNFGLDNCCTDDGLTQRCTAQEVELRTLDGQGRCVQVGDYCSRRSLFGCRERTRTHCCFNSVLGRLIQQQGRAQLGKSWFSDNGEPDCGGLTPAELAAVDWSRLDLREYYAQLQLDPKPLEQASVTQGAEAAQGRCYYGDGKC